MTGSAIVLYGPPASGKSAITSELSALHPDFVLFRRIKIGGGCRDGYRDAAESEVDALHREGLVLYENTRYGNTYLVDQPELGRMIDTGLVPIVHVGQLAGVRAIQQYSAAWLAVLLWCSRATTAKRVRARASGDLDARVAAWDETARDIKNRRAGDFALHIDTTRSSAATAAITIHAALSGPIGGR
ncbi:MAG: guanylate kinase [Pseudonocardiales bacterium]|nr:MAG: guanylate kinase [Pseudonocardiales bacterium]